MLANTKVFAPLFACTDEKSNQKNLKDSKSLKIRIFQGVRAQTYWRISSPTTQKKTIFSLFERVRILTHLPKICKLNIVISPAYFFAFGWRYFDAFSFEVSFSHKNKASVSVNLIAQKPSQKQHKSPKNGVPPPKNEIRGLIAELKMGC